MESEAFEDLEKGGGALRTVKDLAAGAAGGMAQVLLGMWAARVPGLRDASIALGSPQFLLWDFYTFRFEPLLIL